MICVVSFKEAVYDKTMQTAMGGVLLKFDNMYK